MKYFELTKEQFDDISKLSPMRHVSDSGIKTALISRINEVKNILSNKDKMLGLK